MPGSGGVTSAAPRTADAVVVGGGTIGAWCAWFLREAGLADVVLLEQRTLGAGASPRAAGMVRAQGGTEPAVRLGLCTAATSTPGSRNGSGSTRASSRRATSCPASPSARWPRRTPGSRCSRASASTSAGSGPDELDDLNPAMARGMTMGGSYAPGRRLHRPAPQRAGLHRGAVHLRRARRSSTPRSPGCSRSRGAGLTGVARRPGTIATERVVLTGGPTLAAVGRAAGVPDPGRWRAPPGRGHRGLIPTWRRTGCRWSSTSPPASTGGPRRAACSGA